MAVLNFLYNTYSKFFKFFIFFIIFLGLQFSLAGSTNPDKYIDSLITRVNTTKDDTIKIITLLEISEYLKDKNPDSSLFYISKAEMYITNAHKNIESKKNWLLSLIKRNKDDESLRGLTKIEAGIFRLKGEVLAEKKEYEKAFDLLNQSLLKSSQINDVKGCNFSMLEIGKVYLALGNFTKAKENFDFVLNISMLSGYKDCLYEAYCDLGKYYFAINSTDTSLAYYKKALNTSKETGNKRITAETHLAIGSFCQFTGKLTDAIENYRQAIAISKELDCQDIEAEGLFRIGLIYSQQGRSAEAIEVLLRAMQIFEKLNSSSTLSECYLNLGMVYSEKGNPEKSLGFILKSLELNQRMNNPKGIATAYLNLGINYTKLNRTDEALSAYFDGIKNQKIIEDKSGLVNSYIGLGGLYQKTGDYKLANHYFQKALSIVTTVNDPALVSRVHASYSNLLLKVGDLEKAQIETNLALANAKKTNDIPLLLNAIDLIAETYEKNGRYKEAFLHLLQGYRLLDSISKKSKNELIANVEASYITEIKQHELETMSKEKEVQALRIKQNDEIVKKQRVLSYLYLGGFLFVFAFGFLFFQQAQRKKKINEILERQNKDIQQKNEEIVSQRDEIEAQRDEIEAQRNDIARQKEEIEKMFQLQTDSILYARQIQNAILPDRYVFTDNLPDSFIFYRPKDIVSGDFYWVSPIGDKVGFAVVDCTGHGVAGAMLSMLGSSLLTELTAKPEDVDPGDLLTELRSYIIMSLWQRGFIGEQVVGMDMAFCLLDKEKLELRYAGANNPVLIYSKNPDDADYSIVDLKPDKMPISMSVRMNSFSTQVYQLKKGDVIYLFTDGFTDQIGGPNTKKYSVRNFKLFLSTIVHLPMIEQERLLAEEFETWKDKQSQIDDVTIMGIRV